MAKTYLGVDFGYDSVKLALCRNGRVKKTAVVPTPVNLLRGGRVTSPETMGTLLRTAMKENRIHASDAALVLPGETTYLRTCTMPRMNAEQLLYNLPYEFNDYITDELKNYTFDYAMTSVLPEAGNMELLAVAAPNAVLDEAREVLHRAGLKLRKAAPAECSYIALIRAAMKALGADTEYCLLDLGYHAIRMYMFRGDRHMVTRALEVGLSNMDSIVADTAGVDVHIAHTYFVNNYEDCQNGEGCKNAYDSIAVELQRALNFYRFSNPDSRLEDVWLCGGGAAVEPLRDAIAAALDMKVHTASELVENGDSVENCHTFLPAIGATVN